MTVLIPAYEPTDKMLNLILELKAKTNYKILIVDDGSGNRYRELFNKAEAYGCTVLHYSKNKGKGHALKTGFAYLHSSFEPDSVVCADSDGQHSVADIIKLAEAIDINKMEMVLGIRKFEGKVPFKSRLGNSVTALIFKLATGLSINDTQTGLRGYPYKLMPWLCSIEGKGFEYELNLLLKGKSSNISIKQLPIATIYENNNKSTHFRPIRDSINVLMPIFKFCSSSIISGVLDFILLFVFQWLTGSLFWGVVLARVISSLFNYSINRILVFKTKNIPNMQSASRYFGLVFVIMILNYCLLSFMTNTIGINNILSKLFTEVTLFIMSYIVQKFFVFKDKEGRKYNPRPYKI